MTESKTTIVGKPFPVENVRDAIPELRRPFEAASVRFRLQTRRMVVAFIDARLVAERLNLVCPDLWQDNYETVAGVPEHVLCRLTIGGLTRVDVGKASSEDGAKGMYSDAFKRAAVKFGVGISLYSWPRAYILGPEELRRGANNKVQGLTPEAHSRVRKLYSEWLEQRGAQAFGPPLDHGDVTDSVGDFETFEDAQDDDTPTDAPDTPSEKALDPVGRDRLLEVVNSYIATSNPNVLSTKLAELNAGDVPDNPEAQRAAAGVLDRSRARVLWRWIDTQLLPQLVDRYLSHNDHSELAAKLAELSASDVANNTEALRTAAANLDSQQLGLLSRWLEAQLDSTPASTGAQQYASDV